MTNLNRQLEILRKKFERIATKPEYNQEGIFWVLLSGHAVTKNKSARFVIAENNDTADQEESLETLLEEIEMGYEAGNRNMHVRFYGKHELTGEPDDTHKLSIKEIKQESQSNILGNTNTNNALAYLGSIQEHQRKADSQYLAKIHELEKRQIEISFENKMQSLKNEIEAVKEGKKAWFEKATAAINGFIETPAGEAAINQLGGIIQMIIPTLIKTPAVNGLGGMGAVAEPPEIPADLQEMAAIKEEIEKVYNGSTVGLLRLLHAYITTFPDEFERWQERTINKIEKNGR